MIRNMTYLLLTKVFGGVWKGERHNNGLTSTSELRVSSKTFTILDRYVSNLPSSPRTIIPQKPCLRKSNLNHLTSRNPHPIFTLLRSKIPEVTVALTWWHNVCSPARLYEPCHFLGGGGGTVTLKWTTQAVRKSPL